MPFKKIISITSIIAIILLLLSIVAAAITQNTSQEEDTTNRLLDAAENAQNPEKILLTADNREIFKETIDFLVEGDNFSKQNLIEQAPDLYPEEYYQPKTREEIINEQIRSSVILNEAEKLGLYVDYDEAYKIGKDAYDITLQNKDENYEFLLKYMEVLGLSEEEYLDLVAKSYQTSMMKSNLYREFTKDKRGNEEELKKQFEIYVDELVEKAEIIYK